ncbi:hypothetical protein [Polaribacter sp. Hel_I_88]|uniref:hypothetical protein n=1 Tax=Polaribacter sp. Hel_I_88 TaxID=1250006 RepID=UPI0004786DDF|nr:hypothetical protein [Polaribacter sp. Hel_I_88]|tara:strand:- start:267 stop:701 length:435 start_codon:yes stop_codon:yes gene_type:complete
MTYNQLGFALTGLKTVSFATIDSAYKKTGEANLTSELSFGIDTDKNSVSCSVKFSFEKKVNQPFLIIEIQSLFEIEKKDFKTKVKQKNDSYLVTKDLAIHFAVLTIGASRGALHAKTEGTIYNEYLLPTINVKEIIEQDIIFNF